jgi:hypothetical protein
VKEPGDGDAPEERALGAGDCWRTKDVRDRCRDAAREEGALAPKDVGKWSAALRMAFGVARGRLGRRGMEVGGRESVG